MNKRKRLLIPVCLGLASLSFASLSFAFSSPAYVKQADSFTLGINGVVTKLGEADYYFFLDDSTTGTALTKSEGSSTYTLSPNIETVGDHTYKITDNYGKTIYSQSSFNLGITGSFSLSFDSETKASSLTYSFILEDAGKVLGDSPVCYAYSSVVTPVNWWLAGNFNNDDCWSQAKAIRLVANPGSTSDKGMIQHVYLHAGDTFKITDCASESATWLGVGALKYGDAKDSFEGTDNIKAKTAGYYDIYLTSNNEISISNSASDAFSWSSIATGTTDSSSNKTTFVLDATQYASSSTYLLFSSTDNSKASQGISVSNMIASAGASCTLKRSVYLTPGVWVQNAPEWFLAIGKTSGELVQLGKYSNSDTVYSCVMPTNDESVQFFRMNGSYDLGQVKASSWDRATTSKVGEIAYCWNTAGAVKVASNQAYQVPDWNKDLDATDLPSGAPTFVVEKS